MFILPLETVKEFKKRFDPQISEIVYKNFYVDNCLVNLKVKNEHWMDAAARALLLKRGFKLKKLLSTSEAIMQKIPEDRTKTAKNVMPMTTPQHCLHCVAWRVASNEFYFTLSVPSSSATNRNISSVRNSFYDFCDIGEHDSSFVSFFLQTRTMSEVKFVVCDFLSFLILT